MNAIADTIPIEVAKKLADAVRTATDGSTNETNLRHEIEKSLQKQSDALGIPYIPFQLDKTLRGSRKNAVYADVVHGCIIIEYEPPKSFSAGQAESKIKHAKKQAEEYAFCMAHDEGRPINEYVLVVWDGAHIAFGSTNGQNPKWNRIVGFDESQAINLLSLLRDQGQPLVHPGLIKTIIGPDSEIGSKLIPALFQAIISASTKNPTKQSKTTLLFTEWQRLFGQAVGISTERLKTFLSKQSDSHKQNYGANVPCYLFALHTYIAMVAKLVAALALPRPSQDICDGNVPLRNRIRAMEEGRLFIDAGVSNMLIGDFFSWPVDDEAWPNIEDPLNNLLVHLSHLSFDMTKKKLESVRDLFKGIYEEFVPRELRHALGEIYTPDWLAAHALDSMKWQPTNDLLDPTCGTGTFIIEAVRRRLIAAKDNKEEPNMDKILSGLYGIDLNPLAVLAAKASLVVVLANLIDPEVRVRLPIFLADAINTATETDDGYYLHLLQTEKGVKKFKIPNALAKSNQVHDFFEKVRDGILEDCEAEDIIPEIKKYLKDIDQKGKATVTETIKVLVDLHKERWNNIWCSILADRFAVGAIPKLSNIAGNPPWVKWSHLPSSYADFIKPQCSAINVFSNAHYVGGIEADLSTVITFQAIRKWLAPEGQLAFFITATVFSNESSQGFRRFAYQDGTPMCQVLAVEDFKSLKAFDGVTNHPALLVVKMGAQTTFPVPYRVWSNPTEQTSFKDGAEFRSIARYDNLMAEPVPGTDSGPWLKGSQEDLAIWRNLFDATPTLSRAYKARKGVTTDRNGIYFIKATSYPKNKKLVQITNDPNVGRTPNIHAYPLLIETTHIFPLLRGRGLTAFKAEIDPDYRILLPQRGMHGDRKLLNNCPRTKKFLAHFKNELEKRASYIKYQKGEPYWSTWSTGPYTFSPFKVLWKEMSGSRFCAAYVKKVQDPLVGKKVVIPDHKLYMVDVGSLDEARYLTGLLNAPTIAKAISAYASQLSLGTSVIDYLKIPKFDPLNENHKNIAAIAGAITAKGGKYTDTQIANLDKFAVAVVSGGTNEIQQINGSDQQSPVLAKKDI